MPKLFSIFEQVKHKSGRFILLSCILSSIYFAGAFSGTWFNFVVGFSEMVLIS